MKHLEELQTLLLLGTDQTPLGDDLLKYLQNAGIALVDSPEKSAGLAMVYLRQWRRAGFSLEQWKEESRDAQARRRRKRAARRLPSPNRR